MQFRKLMRYPPFSALANVLVRSQKQEQALAMQQRTGTPAGSGAGGCKSAGTGRSAGAEVEERIPLSALDQSGQPQAAERARCATCRSFAVEKKWGATALVIDVDPLTLL